MAPAEDCCQEVRLERKAQCPNLTSRQFRHGQKIGCLDVPLSLYCPYFSIMKPSAHTSPDCALLSECSEEDGVLRRKRSAAHNIMGEDQSRTRGPRKGIVDTCCDDQMKMARQMPAIVFPVAANIRRMQETKLCEFEFGM